MPDTTTARRATATPTRDHTDEVRGATGGDASPPTDPPGGATGNGLTRVTVNLTRQAARALDTVSEATGYSKTDTINRALQVYEIVQDLMARNDGLLQFTEVTGETVRIHIV